MDKALELRMIKNNDSTQASDLLEQSILLKKLTSEFKKTLYAIWCIIVLSEIPHAGKFLYTQQIFCI